MFAVFFENKFVDWWLNGPQDSTWVERTIRAKGWDPMAVEVVWFDRPPQGAAHSFTEDKKLNILAEQIVDGAKAWAIVETRASRPYFVAGVKFSF